jgi:hypothetical protein
MEAKSAPHPRKTFPGMDYGRMGDGPWPDEDVRFAGLTSGTLPEPVAGQNYPPGLWEQARPALRQDDLSERTIPPCWILEARCLDYNQLRPVSRAKRAERPSRNAGWRLTVRRGQAPGEKAQCNVPQSQPPGSETDRLPAARPDAAPSHSVDTNRRTRPANQT